MGLKVKTIFEKIIDKEIPAEIVYENEWVIAIKDIAPQAPVHLLIITKKKIASIQTLEKSDAFLLDEIIEAAKTLAKKFAIDQNGYRLIVNHGMHAGQTIPHLHFHLLGGDFLGPLG
jgi:histidine triad (HIT) family protein